MLSIHVNEAVLVKKPKEMLKICPEQFSTSLQPFLVFWSFTFGSLSDTAARGDWWRLLSVLYDWRKRPVLEYKLPKDPVMRKSFSESSLQSVIGIPYFLTNLFAL